jgi:hypothetical protein
MESKRPAFLKPLLWAYSAVGVFTAISIVVPIIWERKGVGSVPGDTDVLSTANNDVLYELGHGSQCQRDTAVANTISINGIPWTQLQEVCAVIGTSNTPPKLTITVLVTTKSQKYYIIDEVTVPDVFDQANHMIFEPMVQSFTVR